MNIGFLEPWEAVPARTDADRDVEARRCAYRYPKGLCRAPRDPARRWCERHCAERAGATVTGGAEVLTFAAPAVPTVMTDGEARAWFNAR